MTMTLERALTIALNTDSGELNGLWKEVVEVLRTEAEKSISLAEVDRILSENTDPCRCPACHIAEETNEPQGPLPAYMLAYKADELADALADFAFEVDIACGLKHDLMVCIAKHYSQRMVQFAKQLMEEK